MYDADAGGTHDTEHTGTAAAVAPGKRSRTAAVAASNRGAGAVDATPAGAAGPPIKLDEHGTPTDDPFAMHLAPAAAGGAHGPADGAHGPGAQHAHHAHHAHQGQRHHGDHGGEGHDAAPPAASSLTGWLSGVFAFGSRPVTSPTVLPDTGTHPPGQTPAPAPAPPGQAPAPPGQAPAPPGQAPAPPGQAPAPPRPRVPAERLAADAAAAFDLQVPSFVGTLRAAAPATAAVAVALLRAEVLAAAAGLGPDHGHAQASVGVKSDGEVRVLHRGTPFGTVAGQRGAIAHARLALTPDGQVTVSCHATPVGEHTLVIELGRHGEAPGRRETAADTELQTGALLTNLGALQGRR